MPRACLATLLVCLLLDGACAPRGRPPPAFPQLAPSGYSAELQARCFPPPGWTNQPVEPHPRALQRVWVSPTGRTAYGVMRVDLPLPVGEGLTLWGFLTEMRRQEGQSRLLSRQPDPAGQGLRFLAEGGRYRIRGRVITSGATGWVVYAGTLLAEPEIPDELRLAESARDRTLVNVQPPANPH